MRATEARDRLDAVINEFGDSEAKIPDQLEPGTLLDVIDIRFDPERERIVIDHRDD